jgi:hypothetical protein
MAMLVLGRKKYVMVSSRLTVFIMSARRSSPNVWVNWFSFR